MPFTKHGLEILSTADVSAFNECRISDISAEFQDASTWVSHLGMLAVFHDHISKEKRPAALHFIRRIEMALSEYSAMRKEVLDHVSDPFRWSPYYRALHHGETSMSLLYQAFDIARKIVAKDLFIKGENSAMERLNNIYNTSKHEKPVPDESVWLSNEGFHSVKSELKFEEFEDVLRTGGRMAQRLLKG